MVKNKLILLAFFAIFSLAFVSASNALGDINLDGEINNLDVEQISEYIFGGVEIPQGVSIDMNCDNVPNIIDVALLTNYVKRGGPKPSCGEVSNSDTYVNIEMVKIDGIIFEQEPVIINAGDTIEISVYFTSLVYDIDVRVGAQIKNYLETWSESNVFDIVQSQNYKKTLSLKVPSVFEQGVEEELTIEIEGKNGKEIRKIKVQIREKPDNACGDANGDNVLNQEDVNVITSYAFEGVEIPSNVNADLNNDGVVDITDVVLMVNHVNRGDSAPICAEKIIITQPKQEDAEEENTREDNLTIVPPTTGNSGELVIVNPSTNDENNYQEPITEPSTQNEDTSLEDIEQRLDSLEEKVDENNNTLEKILKILTIFFKF